MRGSDERTGALFSYVDLESRVRKDHPLRTIRRLVNEALSALEGEFAALYSGLGRPSIAPEAVHHRGRPGSPPAVRNNTGNSERRVASRGHRPRLSEASNRIAAAMEMVGHAGASSQAIVP